MQRPAQTWGLLAAALVVLGCPGAPPWFEEVSWERARLLLEDPKILLVDAVSDQTGQPGPLPRGIRWKLGAAPVQPPEAVPGSGGVLIIASDEGIAHRSAAALARAGNQPVFVFIPMNADERSRLYASVLQTQEVRSGKDS